MDQEKAINFAKWLKGQKLKHDIAAGESSNNQEFAQFLGVSPQSLSQWTNASRIPSGDNVDRLAQKLGSEVYTLLGLKPKPVDPRLPLVDRLFVKAKPETQDAVIEMMRKDTEREGEDPDESNLLSLA